MAYTKEQINQMSADEYRAHLHNPEFVAAIDSLVPSRKAGTTFVPATARRSKNEFAIQEEKDWEAAQAAEREQKNLRQVEQSANRYTQQTLLREHVLHTQLADGYLRIPDEAGQLVPAPRVTPDLFGQIQEHDSAAVRNAYRMCCDQINPLRNRDIMSCVVDFMERNCLDPRYPQCFHLSYVLLEAARALPTQIAAEDAEFQAQESVRRAQPKPVAEQIEWKGLFGKAALDAMPAAELRQKLLTNKKFANAVDELLGGNRRMPDAPTPVEAPEQIRAQKQHEFLNRVVVTDPETNIQYSENDLSKLPAKEELRLRRILEGGSPTIRAWRELKDTQVLQEAERATYGQ